LYLKIYGNSNREAELIAFELNNLWQKISSSRLADSFFFIRYRDREPHLRLRFRGEPGRLLTGLIPCLNEWFQYLAENGLLSGVTIDTYEREIERYGGPDLIEAAEELFHYDSLATLKMLFLKRAGTLKLDFDCLAVISILEMLENLDLSPEEQLDWLNSVAAPRDYLDDFRQSRRLLMELGDPSGGWAAFRLHQNGGEIYNIFQVRQAALTGFAAKLKVAKAGGRLWNTKTDIIASIIHLHCNRLLGADRDHEKKIMTLARHTLSSLKLYQKEQNSKTN
jgi:thiopeptide-type bacteriocin biosynthesis protein